MTEPKNVPISMIQQQMLERLKQDFSFEPHVEEQRKEEYNIEDFMKVDESDDSENSDSNGEKAVNYNLTVHDAI